MSLLLLILLYQAPLWPSHFSLNVVTGNRSVFCYGAAASANIIPYKTRTVALPSDSTFAVAMKTQQAAEREEQQRIKNLVLNYDLRDGEDQDGDSLPPFFA
jgi:hypothetical protein